jgi:glycosyltransferase involved in cell wall biosynthesis
MRILCVSTDYPPLGSGGYERQCRDNVEHLRARGHYVRLLTGTAPPLASENDVYRELPRFPVRPRPVPLDIAWRAERSTAATVSRHIAAFRPDAACLWRLGEVSMSLPARIASAGIPSVGMVCDPWLLEGPRRDPYARFCRPRFDGMARWLFVSRPLRDQVIAGGVDVSGSEIVPAGVDLGVFRLAQVRSWRWRLLYAGRLSPLKGVDLAIRALARTPPPRRSTSWAPATLDTRIACCSRHADSAWPVACDSTASCRESHWRVRMRAPTPSCSPFAGASRSGSCRSRRWRPGLR